MVRNVESEVYIAGIRKMVKEAEAYVILDANILVHYKRISDIDWCGLTEHKKVNLVIFPKLLSELSKQGWVGKTEAIRNRVARQNKWLDGCISDYSKEIRCGVKLYLISQNPLKELKDNGIDLADADSYYVMMAHKLKEEGKNIVVASADRGVIMQLRLQGFKCILPPDEDRLAPEFDPVAKKNQEFESQLKQLRTEQPSPIRRGVGQESIVNRLSSIGSPSCSSM